MFVEADSQRNLWAHILKKAFCCYKDKPYLYNSLIILAEANVIELLEGIRPYILQKDGRDIKHPPVCTT